MTGWSSFIILLALSLPIAAMAQTSSNHPILSEFLCNPMGDLETEWIEIYNPTENAVNLTQYKIGDALGLRSISDTGLMLLSGEYIVLAEDPVRFLAFYDDFEGTVISPDGWQTLNNYGGEVVRLADNDDLIVDSIYYEDGFPDNRSRERYIDPSGKSYWGGSFAPEGSTPGKPNTYYYPRAGNIDLAVTPDPFSPDGDGFEDETTISYGMPDADRFDLMIYDIAGRKVRTLLESCGAIPGGIVWDGRGDDGRILPVGIYIIHARVEGGVTMEGKKTVVIAR